MALRQRMACASVVPGSVFRLSFPAFDTQVLLTPVSPCLSVDVLPHAPPDPLPPVYPLDLFSCLHLSSHEM